MEKRMTNTYDKENIVQRVSMMVAGGLKFAAYRVRNPAAQTKDHEWSSLQFHLTYMPHEEVEGRTLVNDSAVAVCAVVPEHIAEGFVKFFHEAEAKATEITVDKPYTGGSIFIDFIASLRSDGNIEYQIRLGSAVLAVMLKGMARLFCTMVQSALVKANAEKGLAQIKALQAAKRVKSPRKVTRRIPCPAPKKSKKKKKAKTKK